MYVHENQRYQRVKTKGNTLHSKCYTEDCDGSALHWGLFFDIITLMSLVLHFLILRFNLMHISNVHAFLFFLFLCVIICICMFVYSALGLPFLNKLS